MRASSRLLLKTILFLGLIRILSSQENIFTYQPDYDLALPQSLSNSIEITDVNNDNINDIILSGYDSTRFGIFLDVLGINTDGVISTFSQSNLVTFPDSIAQHVGGVGNIDLADINRDGYIDIYLKI